MCLISVAFQQPLWSDNGQLGVGVIGRTCGAEILSPSLFLPLLLHPPPSPHPSPLMFTPQLCSLPPLPGTLPAPPFLEMTLHLPTSPPSVPMECPNPWDMSQLPKPGWEVSDLWGPQKCRPTLLLTFGPLLFLGGQEKAEAWEEEVGEKGERRRENMFLIC